MSSFELLQGDSLEILRMLDGPFNATVTSPPYWRVKDYKHPQQQGQESTPEEYIDHMAAVFKEVYRLTAPDGTLWVNIGDTYWKKELVGIPWLLVFALKKQGWIWRSEIIWHKLGGKPEPCKDRPSRNHEVILMFSKNKHYYYDYEAVLEPHTNKWAIDCIKKAQEQGVTGRPRSNPFSKEERRAKGTKGITRAEYGALMNPKGKNRRTVWSIKPAWSPVEHYAMYPEDLVKPCILAGCPEDGLILDPYCGTATTGAVALKLKRNFVGIELTDSSIQQAREKLNSVVNELQSRASEASSPSDELQPSAVTRADEACSESRGA